jgi:nucleotide-binding universal stress UspA family protein
MFQRLLICTDLTDGLQRLVHFVPSLAANGVQQITFLHVVPLEGRGVPKPDESKVQRAREQLTFAETEVPSGVEVKVEVQAGRPGERIQAAAKANRSDLIILGTESRSMLSEKLFGSTGTTLCQNSTVPVLIMRPQLLSAYTVEELDLRCRHIFRYFLMPYDGGKASEYLISQVKHYAKDGTFNSLQECLLLWVVENDDRIEKLLHESRVQTAETKLAAVKRDLEQLDITVTAQVLTGDPIPEVLKAALEYDITAIAVASATLGKLVEISSPSFTGELLRRSWHPILFFPPIQ